MISTAIIQSCWSNVTDGVLIPNRFDWLMTNFKTEYTQLSFFGSRSMMGNMTVLDLGGCGPFVISWRQSFNNYFSRCSNEPVLIFDCGNFYHIKLILKNLLITWNSFCRKPEPEWINWTKDIQFYTEKKRVKIYSIWSFWRQSLNNYFSRCSNEPALICDWGNFYHIKLILKNLLITWNWFCRKPESEWINKTKDMTYAEN